MTYLLSVNGDTMKTFKTFAAAAALACAVAVGYSAPASAALLDGQTIQLTYVFPDSSTNFEGPFDYTVGTSPDRVFFGLVSANVSDTNITASMDFSGSFNNTSFNGIRLHDFYGTVASFTSAFVNVSSNVAGFDNSRVTFDADNVYLNFRGLNVSGHNVFSVDINGGAVPEPATWAMMIIGFGAAGSMIRRRKVAVA